MLVDRGLSQPPVCPCHGALTLAFSRCKNRKVWKLSDSYCPLPPHLWSCLAGPSQGRRPQAGLPLSSGCLAPTPAVFLLSTSFGCVGQGSTAFSSGAFWQRVMQAPSGFPWLPELEGSTWGKSEASEWNLPELNLPPWPPTGGRPTVFVDPPQLPWPCVMTC